MKSFYIALILCFLFVFEITQASKTYAQLRSDCAGRTCKKLDKNNKMVRDMCLHKCIHKDCYFAVYWDLDKVTPRYTGSATENSEKNRRKKEFMDCFNENVGTEDTDEEYNEDL